MINLSWRKIGALLIVLLPLLSLPAKAQQADGLFIEGQDFRLIQKDSVDIGDDLENLQAIADIEVFYWYGCYSCWQVESALVENLADKPDLNIIRTPLVAHLAWREQAYLQPLMEQLREQIPLPTELDVYQACLADCSVFANYEGGRDWLLAQAGVESVGPIDEAAIWQAEKNYRNRAESFSISQVPTIIIKESYVVDADSAKSVERMIQIINYLLTR